MLGVFYLYLFELDQTFFTADVFTVVLHVHHQLLLKDEGAAQVTRQQRQVVDFVVVDETSVAADVISQALQHHLELALETKQGDYCGERLPTFCFSLNKHSYFSPCTRMCFLFAYMTVSDTHPAF